MVFGSSDAPGEQSPFLFAVLDMESLNGVELVAGMKVWVDMPHMPNAFAGDVMYAEVVDGALPAASGSVWVKQLATAACPIIGDPWISEQPAIRCLAV